MPEFHTSTVTPHSAEHSCPMAFTDRPSLSYTPVTSIVWPAPSLAFRNSSNTLGVPKALIILMLSLGSQEKQKSVGGVLYDQPSFYSESIRQGSTLLQWPPHHFHHRSSHYHDQDNHHLHITTTIILTAISTIAVTPSSPAQPPGLLPSLPQSSPLPLPLHDYSHGVFSHHLHHPHHQYRHHLHHPRNRVSSCVSPRTREMVASQSVQRCAMALVGSPTRWPPAPQPSTCSSSYLMWPR